MEVASITQELILEALRAIRERLHNEFGIERIGLYGSFARNEQTEKSDVDLVYDLEMDRQLSLLQRILKRYMLRKPELINQRYINPFTRYTMFKDVIYV